MRAPVLQAKACLEDALHEFASAPVEGRFQSLAGVTLHNLIDQNLIHSPVPVSCSAAEEELLPVYRCELAYLLRVVFLRVYAQQRVRHMGPIPAVLSPDELRLRARILAESIPNEPDLHAASSLLSHSLRVDPTPSSVDTRAILLAALRLADAPNTRLYLVHDFLSAGDLRGAFAEAHRLAEWPLDSHGRICVQELLAVLSLEVGDLGTASAQYAEAHKMARRDGHDGATSLLNLFACALDRGDAEDARRSAEEIERSCTPYDEVVTHFANFTRHSNGILSATGWGTLLQIREDLGPVGQRLYQIIHRRRIRPGSPVPHHSGTTRPS